MDKTELLCYYSLTLRDNEIILKVREIVAVKNFNTFHMVD
jgi:hypothetical protein